jgi:hypothetical protein
MYCLSELKDLFEQHGYKIDSYFGHTLVVQEDSYGIYRDQIYCNGKPVDKKELIAKIKGNQNKD